MPRTGARFIEPMLLLRTHQRPDDSARWSFARHEQQLAGRLSDLLTFAILATKPANPIGIRLSQPGLQRRFPEPRATRCRKR